MAHAETRDRSSTRMLPIVAVLGLLSLMVVGQPFVPARVQTVPLAVVLLMAAAGLMVGYRTRVAMLASAGALGLGLAQWLN